MIMRKTNLKITRAIVYSTFVFVFAYIILVMVFLAHYGMIFIFVSTPIYMRVIYVGLFAVYVIHALMIFNGYGRALRSTLDDMLRKAEERNAQIDAKEISHND